MLDDTPEGFQIRAWRDDADFDACADVLRAATAHDGFVRVRDGERWRSMLDQLGGDPTRDVFVAQAGSEIVGFAMTFDFGRDDPKTRLLIHNIVVAPPWRGQMVEHGLLKRAVERLEEMIGAWPSPAGVDVRLGQELSEHERYLSDLLTGDGYSITRYLVKLVRPLDEPMPPIALPPGIEVRPVTLDTAIKVLGSMSVGAVEEGLPAFSDAYLAAELADPIFGQIEHWMVAWDGDEPVGSVLGWIDAEENTEQHRRRGYTERITTMPAWRRRGIASNLLVLAMDHFRSMGMTEAALGVDAENASGAFGLYERLGFRRESTNLILDKPVRAGESQPPRAAAG